MKTIKYLFLGALTLSFSAPVAAQDQAKAVFDKATEIIKSDSPTKEKDMKALYKENKEWRGSCGYRSCLL